MDRVASAAMGRKQPHLSGAVQQPDAVFTCDAGHNLQRANLHKSLEQVQQRQLLPLRFVKRMLEAVVERCRQRPRPPFCLFVGPYGDALTQELYPYIEKQFRGIGEPWARSLYGGSTGGWRVLALQVFYPDFFNGAWVSCPDPIDFSAYSLVNLYQDKNAFYAASTWKEVPIPMERTADGKVLSVMEDAIRFELVLGAKGRSGEQFDIWQAVYSPVGEDGYPKLILDPHTGVIDHQA